MNPATTSSPTVSVLVTLFNRERYIADTIHSILQSDFQDYEVIIVDDCSDDDSFRIAKDFESKYSSVQVYRNESNLGDYENRRRAASLANGEFIKYVDSDDIIYPRSLSLMVDAMRKHQSAALGLSHSKPEDDSPYPILLTPAEAYKKHFINRGCMSCGPSGAIIRRDAFEAANGFDSDWGVLSDIDLWLRIATTFPIVLLPPALVWWRRHSGQEFSKPGAKTHYIGRGHELCMQALEDANCPLSLADRKTALHKQKQHFARRILAVAVRKRQIIEATKLFRSSGLSIKDLSTGLMRYRK